MVKVAFFTNDLKNIDAHFGSAPQFAVYDVDAEGFSLFEVVQTGEERTDGRVEMLQDSSIDIVYCTEIGPAAAAKVVNSKIFPIKYKEIVSIETELNKLSSMMATNPPPFIKKILEARA
jgi:nitrogen fixation protein NifX